MWMAMVVMALMGAAGAEATLFTSPDALEDATGVELRAQLPESSEALATPEPGASLWYMPVAAVPLDRGTGIYYQRVEKIQPEYLDQRVLCLGYYRDGQWTVPALREEPVPWGGPNNVVLRRSPYTPTWGGFNQHQVVRDGERFRMLYWDQPSEEGLAGGMLAESKDGIGWEKDPRGTVFTEHNDAFTLLRMGDRFLLYQTKLEDWPEKPYPDNLDKKRRVQSLRESKDLVEWTGQDVFLRPDAEDAPETEFYLLRAFPYGGKYFGILMKYFGDPAAPNKHSSILRNELMVSDDARTWRRPFRGTDLGFFSFAEPFMDGGRLCFASWKDGGLRLFKYRPNRLVGVVAEGDGEFVTPPIEGPLEGLTLDADARRGWIEVQLLDAAKTPVPGREPVRLEGVDDEALPLAFPGEGALPTGYRLRLRLHDATVYATGR